MVPTENKKKQLRAHSVGDVLAVLGLSWPLITFAIMLVYDHFHPPGPQMHWQSVQAEASAMTGMTSKVLAIGFFVSAVGFLASRRRPLRVSAIIGMCLNLFLAVIYGLTFF